ncbi:MAG: peptidylprolyl isomerase [Acidimicrobiales bacterium]
MGTTKRERQKAGRQARLEELQRLQQRQKVRRNAWRIGLVVGGLLAVGLIIAFVFPKDDKTPVATSDTTFPLPNTTAVSVPTSVTTPVATTRKPYVYGTGECPPADGSSPRKTLFDQPPKQCIDPAKKYSAVFDTNKGSFTVALNSADSPGTVNNFVVLARYHYYDTLTCHRIIKDFVVQCGDPSGTGGGVEPGYTILDELPAAGSYKAGSVAMANAASPNTGGGQFFIITGPNGAALPTKYSLFGQVITGYDDTVKAIEAAADPNATNGTPTKEKIIINKVTITES